MSEVSAFRGKQVTVGELAFQLPESIPQTDAEIIDREEMVAQIRLAIEPHENTVKWGKSLIKAVQGDIEHATKQRVLDGKQEALEFEGSDAK